VFDKSVNKCDSSDSIEISDRVFKTKIGAAVALHTCGLCEMNGRRDGTGVEMSLARVRVGLDEVPWRLIAAIPPREPEIFTDTKSVDDD
jgi:hypothetical protein